MFVLCSAGGPFVVFTQKGRRCFFWRKRRYCVGATVGAGVGQTKVRHAVVVSRLYIHPVEQSSARGSVTVGQTSPALDRRSKETFFIADKTTTKRINASVKNRIKFQDFKSVLGLPGTRIFLFAILPPAFNLLKLMRTVKRTNTLF